MLKIHLQRYFIQRTDLARGCKMLISLFGLIVLMEVDALLIDGDEGWTDESENEAIGHEPPAALEVLLQWGEELGRCSEPRQEVTLNQRAGRHFRLLRL